MHDVGIRDGVRIFQIDMPVAQLEDLLNGRALLQLDRVLDRTLIAFAPAAAETGQFEQLGFPMDGQEIGEFPAREAEDAEAVADAEEEAAAAARFPNPALDGPAS
jgi:hypothetical protein